MHTVQSLNKPLFTPIMTLPLSDSQKDSNLESFIAMARQDDQLRSDIKAALNQDQVIDIALSRGFSFDSLTILRRWSKHTDFSQDTWLGWFSE